MEFTEIWREEFHEGISPDEARPCATLLLELYALLAGLPAASPGPASDSSSGTPQP